jgi:hypothetical protein
LKSKNINKTESQYFGVIKSMPCGVCGAPPPSDAHHIEQGSHFTCIPLCKDCHQGNHNGLHGRRHIWNVMKKTEMSVLNATIGELFENRLLTVRTS